MDTRLDRLMRAAEIAEAAQKQLLVVEALPHVLCVAC